MCVVATAHVSYQLQGACGASIFILLELVHKETQRVHHGAHQHVAVPLQFVQAAAETDTNVSTKAVWPDSSLTW